MTPKQRTEEKKRINSVVNRITKRKSKCCNARIVYVVTSGTVNTVKRCSKCFNILKYTD